MTTQTPYDAVKRRLEDLPVDIYGRALRALEAARVPALVGGGLAIACSGHRRPTKDIDIHIFRHNVERALHALAAAGFTVFDMDVGWLRKAKADGVEIDLILSSRGSILLTPEELERSVRVVFEGVPMTIFAVEDLLLRKVYARRDDGGDWLDALMLLDRGDSLDWRRLDREDLDPRPMAAFLLLAEVRGTAGIPPHLVERLLQRVQHRRTRRTLGAGPGQAEGGSPGARPGPTP